jgi:hypothetical protein
VRLPASTSAAAALGALRDGVRTPGVPEPALSSLAAAIAELAKPRKGPEGAQFRPPLRTACGCRRAV